MPSYTTLQAVRTHGDFAVDKVSNDAALASLIRACSFMIDQWCGQNFDVRTDQFGFSGLVGSVTLDLHMRPLLSITTLVNGDGTTVANTNYDLLPLFHYPKERVRLKQGNYWLSPAGITMALVPAEYAEDAIAITGEYGYVPDYPTKCWSRSTAKVGANMTDTTGTSLTVDTVGQLDVGNVIRVGTEQMRVAGPVASTATATVLTVERGYNGSTAATHTTGDGIDVFQMDLEIELAAKEFVLGVFHARTAPGSSAKSAPGFGSVSLADMPDKVREKLVPPYWNWQWGMNYGRSR